MKKELLEALKTKEKPPEIEQPKSWPYDEKNQKIPCARCGGPTKMIGNTGGGSYNMESYECPSCCTCMEMEVVYVRQRTAGGGELMIPTRLELIQVW
jgi:hypothetical protein